MQIAAQPTGVSALPVEHPQTSSVLLWLFAASEAEPEVQVDEAAARDMYLPLSLVLLAADFVTPLASHFLLELAF